MGVISTSTRLTIKNAWFAYVKRIGRDFVKIRFNCMFGHCRSLVHIFICLYVYLVSSGYVKSYFKWHKWRKIDSYVLPIYLEVNLSNGYISHYIYPTITRKIRQIVKKGLVVWPSDNFRNFFVGTRLCLEIVERRWMKWWKASFVRDKHWKTWG